MFNRQSLPFNWFEALFQADEFNTGEESSKPCHVSNLTLSVRSGPNHGLELSSPVITLMTLTIMHTRGDERDIDHTKSTELKLYQGN